MLDRRARKVLNVYTEHIGRQEADISRLNSILDDFRSEFGPIEMSNHPEVKKASLERQLQEIRKKNQMLQIRIKTEENSIIELENGILGLQDTLQTLASEVSDKEVTSLREEVKNLAEQEHKLDFEIREMEDKLQELMSTRSF